MCVSELLRVWNSWIADTSTDCAMGVDRGSEMKKTADNVEGRKENQRSDAANVYWITDEIKMRRTAKRLQWNENC